MKARFAIVLSLLWPAIGHACSVCYAANDRNRAAFFDTTLLLSFLPLGMLGGGIAWFAKRAGLQLSEEFGDRDARASQPGRSEVPPPPGS
jgi:hypothetical protein